MIITVKEIDKRYYYDGEIFNTREEVETLVAEMFEENSYSIFAYYHTHQTDFTFFDEYETKFSDFKEIIEKFFKAYYEGDINPQVLEAVTTVLYNAYNCEFPLSFYTEGDFSIEELTGYTEGQIFALYKDNL